MKTIIVLSIFFFSFIAHADQYYSDPYQDQNMNNLWKDINSGGNQPQPQQNNGFVVRDNSPSGHAFTVTPINNQPQNGY